jgi:predicted RNase H-like HicB family nuclease
MRSDELKRAEMKLTVEIDREQDGRWIAEVVELPGVVQYGSTQAEALDRVTSLALRVIAERIENGESIRGTTIHFEERHLAA